MKKNYQAPKSTNVVLLTPITMQQFNVGSSIISGTPGDPIETE